MECLIHSPAFNNVEMTRVADRPSISALRFSMRMSKVRAIQSQLGLAHLPLNVVALGCSRTHSDSPSRFTEAEEIVEARTMWCVQVLSQVCTLSRVSASVMLQ